MFSTRLHTSYLMLENFLEYQKEARRDRDLLNSLNSFATPWYFIVYNHAESHWKIHQRTARWCIWKYNIGRWICQDDTPQFSGCEQWDRLRENSQTSQERGYWKALHRWHNFNQGFSVIQQGQKSCADSCQFVATAKEEMHCAPWHRFSSWLQ